MYYISCSCCVSLVHTFLNHLILITSIFHNQELKVQYSNTVTTAILVSKMTNLKYPNPTHTASQVINKKAVVCKQNFLSKISSNKEINKNCNSASQDIKFYFQCWKTDVEESSFLCHYVLNIQM